MMYKVYKPFALFLLASTSLAARKNVDDTPSNPRPVKEIASDMKPLAKEMAHSVKDSVQQTGSDLWDSLNDEFQQLQRKFAKLGEDIQNRMSAQIQQDATLVEDAQNVRLSIQLPHDIDYSPNNLEIGHNERTDSRSLNFSITDERYDVRINVIFRRHLIAGNVRIESQPPVGSNRRAKLYRESSFRHTIAGTPQFDKVTAEYNTKTHVLSFVIPKEFHQQTKRTLKVRAIS